MLLDEVGVGGEDRKSLREFRSLQLKVVLLDVVDELFGGMERTGVGYC